MLTASADSASSADVLWARVVAVTEWADHLDTFTSVRHVGGPDPIATGSRFEAEQPGLPTAVWEVTEWSPGTSFTWTAPSRGVTTTAVHTVTPTPDGSRLDLEVRWTGPLAGLVRLLVGRRTQRMIEHEASTFVGLAAADAHDG